MRAKEGVKYRIFGAHPLASLYAEFIRIVGPPEPEPEPDPEPGPTCDAPTAARSLDDLRRLIDRTFEDSNFEYALQIVLLTMVQAFTTALERRQLCHGSPVLDDICADIGKRVRRSGIPAKGTASFSEPFSLPTDLYIATELYRNGGHTALIGDYVRANPDRESVVLVTNISDCQDSIEDAIRDRLALPPDRVHVCPEHDLVEKLMWLNSAIDALRPDRILLFNHMHDSVAAAAIDPDIDAKWWFVHHSDRLPCLGAHRRDVVHVDVTLTCYAACQKRGIPEHRYVPLTAVDYGCRDFTNRPPNQRLTTASSGAQHKFGFDYRPSYIEVMAGLLARTGGKHVHIGPLDHEFMQRFHQELERRGVPQERLVHVPHVASVWKAMAEHDVDLCVGSFPQPGAKTSVEVMGSGTPMTWHASTAMTDHQATSMRYPEAVVWRHPAELEDLVDRIDTNWLKLQSAHARAHFERAHHPRLTRQGFDGDCSTLLPHDLCEVDVQSRNVVEFDELLGG